MGSRILKSILLLCLVLPAGLGAGPEGQRATPQTSLPGYASAMANLKFREIGPAIMGGRVDEFAVVESDPKIVYAGLATGGVWKTTNAGTTWEPIFDCEASSSIGAIALAPSDPSVVWVGTGEANNRQSSSWGNGVYKSTDAGRTWQHMGLAETQHIGRLIIHPTNPNIVYAAALGRLWAPNRERGVFKTTDGGRTWQNVLYVNEDTGVVDIAIDRLSPDTLYAAAYQRRRTVFNFNGGGPHSAIYKTTDGATTWKKLTRGLPYENEKESQTGRIGLSVYRRNPSIVYSIIEHADGGVFRSEDSGETWTRMSDVNPRPAYYSQIKVDPNNDLRVWVLSPAVNNSEDGGKTFITTRVGRIHVDFHAIWIDPRDSNHMLLGSDGGITQSWDAGKTWDFMNTIAIGQFYEIGYDMQKPYRISGGLQDNGSWIGPSLSLTKWGRWAPPGSTNSDWIEVDGSDGYYTVIDPTDPNIVYAEIPYGIPLRRDLRSNESRPIRPSEAKVVGTVGDPAYRFHWNTPIVISAHDPKVIYCAAQFLYRSTDRGDSWTRISPDLTTGVDQNSLPVMGRLPREGILSVHDGIGYWPCIATVSESPLNPGVLWVGTDDGNLQVTRDGGKTWQNVASRVPGVPKGTYVSRVIASRHAEGSAYVTFDGHRMNDFEVYVFATTDFGETFQPISRGLPRNNGTVRAIREHHRNPNLLFVGTEYGAYVSFDRGAGWVPLKLNLPTVPVSDIAIHPRENDLILGTHGRSIWILDDITPLEQMDSRVLASDVHLFDIRPTTAWRIYDNRNDHAGPGHKFFVGENPPYGAILNYYLKTKPAGNEKVMITVEDGAGKKIREFEGTDDVGLNRVAWDLRYGPPSGLQGTGSDEGLRGPTVEPGTYSIKVSIGQKQMSKPAVVEEDPRIKISPPDREARRQAMMRAYDLSGRAAQSSRTIGGLRSSLAAALEEWKQPNAPKVPEAARKDAEELLKKVDTLQERYVPPPRRRTAFSSSYLTWRPPTIMQSLPRLSVSLEGCTAVPTQSQMEELEAISRLINETVAATEKLTAVDLTELNRKLNQAGLPPIRISNPQATGE